MTAPPQVTGFTGLTQSAQLTLENNAGEQLLLAQTAGAATMSLTTQPTAAGMTTTGANLHVYIIGNPGSGTMTFTGTAPVTGGAVVSQTYHINAAPLNGLGASDFTTSEVFATVTPANITLTSGLLPCTVMIYGSPAGKYLVPITADAEEMIPKFSPADKRGILWKNLRVVPLVKGAKLDKWDAAVYADSLWMLYMLVTSNPTITTVPASPSTLLAATTRAATMTLTTAPVTPGMFMIITPAGNSVAGTAVFNGKDIYGNNQNETVTIGANNNVVYSAKRYSSLNVPGTSQFTTTGLSVGATLAVTGVYAWTFTGTWDGLTNTTKSSACLSLFDGVMGVKLPYTILTDGTFDWQKDKEVLFTGKGEAQDYLVVGDPNPSPYPSGTNPFATLAQPTTKPMVAWPGSFFIDTLPGTPLTTQDGSLLTFKAQLMTGLAPFRVGDGMQRWSNTTYTTEPDYSIDATLVLQNYQYYVNLFKLSNRVVFGATFTGDLLGSTGGSTYWEQVQFTFPGRIETFKPERSKNPVEGAFKVMSEYAFDLGYAFKMAMTAQVPPTYTS